MSPNWSTDSPETSPGKNRRVRVALAVLFAAFFCAVALAPLGYALWHAFGRDQPRDVERELRLLAAASPEQDAALAVAHGDFRLYVPIVHGEPRPLDWPPERLRKAFRVRYVRLIGGEGTSEEQSLNNAALGYVARYNRAVVEAAVKAGMVEPPESDWKLEVGG